MIYEFEIIMATIMVKYRYANVCVVNHCVVLTLLDHMILSNRTVWLLVIKLLSLYIVQIYLK